MIQLYNWAIEALLVYRVAACIITSFLCFIAYREMNDHLMSSRPLVKIKDAMLGFGVFHLIIAITTSFAIGATFTRIAAQHVIATLAWTVGVTITSVVTTRLVLFLMGVTNGVHKVEKIGE